MRTKQKQLLMSKLIIKFNILNVINLNKFHTNRESCFVFLPFGINISRTNQLK